LKIRNHPDFKEPEMIRVGSVVAETETDLSWCTYPGQTGVVVHRADKEMGFSPGEAGFGRFWMVCFGEELMVFMDTDLVVV